MLLFLINGVWIKQMSVVDMDFGFFSQLKKQISSVTGASYPSGFSSVPSFPN